MVSISVNIFDCSYLYISSSSLVLAFSNILVSLHFKFPFCVVIDNELTLKLPEVIHI